MNEQKVEKNLIKICCVIFYVLFFCFAILGHKIVDKIHNLEDENNNIKQEIEVLQEDLQIQKAIFSSYLNGTLSNDGGGE